MLAFIRSFVFGSVILFILSACGGGGGGGGNDGNDDTDNDGDVISDVTVLNVSSSALARVIPPGAECPTGGIQVDSGIDDNGNGILDPAEIDTSETICNGEVGSDGVTSLVEQTEVQPGLVCAAGGLRFDAGRDANANGVLDGFEITSSEFLCSDGLFGSVGAGRPVIVSAISISNTEVVVQFSEPMLQADAENPVNYDINSEERGTTLPVWDAAFYNPDNSTVLLSTFSQSSVGYVLVVSNMRDLDGNPIADPTILIDPSRTTFSGTEPSGPTVADSDGDTLPDHVELIGWDVTITYGNGTTETRRVTSDPGNPTLPVDDPINVAARDTDGEGVADNEERHGNMDPRQPDTDGDTLTDNQEWNIIYSSPTQQDTDGDGTEDGFEFYSYRTSPTLADTDGDQINDTDEVLARNRDPRIADIPRAGIDVGEVRLLIDERYTFEDAQGETVSVESSSSSTLSQSNNRTFARSNAGVTQHVAGGSVKVGGSSETESKVGVSLEPFKKNVKLASSVEVEGNYQYTTSSSWNTSRSSQIESQKVHQRSLQRTQEFNTTSTVTREVFGASIDVDVTIRNVGDLAFTIRNLEITVLQADRQSTGRFVPVATLIANSTLITGAPAVFNLGPFTPERGPILFSSRDVFPTLVEQLMAAPSGLIFKVANFDMTDEFGRVFSFANQEARDRTAGIIIDFGGGEAQQNLVATALQPVVEPVLPVEDYPSGSFVGGFNPDGSPLGIPLDFALQDILGLTKNAAVADGIVAGPDRIAQTPAQGDDVQEVPVGTTGLNVGTVVVSSGQDGILETAPAPGDLAEITTGYETSLTCDATSVEAGDVCSVDGDCTGGTCSGPEVLVRVNGFRNGDLDRVWAVLSNSKLPAGANFGRIVLQPGTDVYLAFVQDLDEDGLFAREEYLLGSTDSRADLYDNSEFGSAFDPLSAALPPDSIPDSKDTDRDGLSDFAEARIGWRISAEAGEQRQVFSSPRLRDSDGDGLLDPQEQDIRNYCADQQRPPGPATGGVDDPRPPTAWCAFLSEPAVGIGEAVAIIAGLDGVADTIPEPFSDDRALISQGFTGLTFATVVIDAGPDGIMQTNVAAGDEYASLASLSRVPPATDPGNADTDVDGISDFDELEGFETLHRIWNAGSSNATALTRAIGDDVQHVPVGEALPDLTGSGLTINEVVTLRAVVLPGPNGVIDSSPAGGFEIFLPPLIRMTDPLVGDTDGDQISDGRERALWANPLSSLDGPQFRDTDQDGLSDAEEALGWLVSINRGVATRIPSNPNLPDSDLDGLPDLIERDIRSNPSSPDSDGDTLSDFDEFADFARYAGVEQQFPGFSVNGSASARYGTSPVNGDTEPDGLPDIAELITGYRILVPGEASFRQIHPDPLVVDTDLDGRIDLQEWFVDFTDATDPDTDGDGRTDGQEASAGSDPLVPDTAVTIRLERLVSRRVTPDGANNRAEMAWWFMTQGPADTDPVLLADARDQSALQTFAFRNPASGIPTHLGCLNVEMAGGTFHNLNLNRERRIVLREGQVFTLHGMIAELDSVTEDCGLAPNFIPTGVSDSSGCTASFTEIFSYNDFAAGTTGEVLIAGVNVPSCEFEIQYSLDVQ